MIAIPVSGEVVRRTLRTFLVAACIAVALAMYLQFIFALQKSFAPGDFGFNTVANVVFTAQARARRAGISVGDRIDYSLMPQNERYGDPDDGLRQPPVGKRVSFVVDHDGRRHVALLAAGAFDWGAYLQQGKDNVIFGSAADNVIFIVIVLLGSTLFLIRPTMLTAAFFLYALGESVQLPTLYSFLPGLGYAAFVAVSDAFLGLGAIGFLLLGLSLDPTRQISLRSAVVTATVLFALIVAPLAISDVLELVHGTRPAWPIAGWASFAAWTFCYVAGFALLIRAAIKASTPRSLRFAAALLAYTSVAPLFLWMTGWSYDNWYAMNLPTAILNRDADSNLPLVWWEAVVQLAVFLPAGLAVSYAFIRAASFGRCWTFFRVACYTVLALWIVARFLLIFFMQGFFGQLAVYAAAVGTDTHFLRLLCYLLAFYLIVRARVADTGPVFSRVVAHVIVALLAIAAFVVVTLEFAPGLPNNALTLLIPAEVLAAIAIGYWASGLRDLSGCLSLACVDAWNAWANGHAREERDALTRSLGLAERTRRPGVIAEVRAQAAFSAWRDGDDGEFERNADALQGLLGERNVQGLRGFARAATSRDDELRFSEDDLPEWRARAALLLFAQTNDAGRAQQLANDALASADRAGSAALQVLASVAVAETCPDQRDSALERANSVARDAGWPALSKSILALRANSRDIGILQNFVDVRLRRSRPVRPMFEISFFNAELCRYGVRIPLPEKQLELLLTVASARSGINDNELIDTVWPESEGDAARNSFRVSLHRLRESASDARIVTRVGKGYVLHPWADVDLWRFQSLTSSYREKGGRETAQQLGEMCEALRAGEGRRATLGGWFYGFEQTLRRRLDEAERLLDRQAARIAPLER